MIQFIYPLFFWILVAQVVFFCFLNLPSPKGWKGAVVKFLTTNIYVRKLLKVHLWICMVAAFFFYDSYTTQQKFSKQKNQIKGRSDPNGSNQLRGRFLSYQILKTQRNEYITLMLIYVSIILNIYLQILNYMYDKRQKYQTGLKFNGKTDKPKQVEQRF